MSAWVGGYLTKFPLNLLISKFQSIFKHLEILPNSFVQSLFEAAGILIADFYTTKWHSFSYYAIAKNIYSFDGDS